MGAMEPTTFYGQSMQRMAWLLAFLALPVVAEEDWNALRQEAKGLRSQAKQVRKEAKQTFESSNAACWQKVLVSSCMEDARQEKLKAERDAQQIDLQALAVERRVKAHDRELRQAKREARQLKLETK